MEPIVAPLSLRDIPLLQRGSNGTHLQRRRNRTHRRFHAIIQAMSELAGRRVYTVSQIAGILQSELEAAFPDLWVEGEVSQFKKAASGHLYFTLREGKATLGAVMFLTHARRLGFEPEAGMRLLARGKLSYYPEGGSLQLYATWLEPSGVGALMVALEQAKRRLVGEGLTDASRKRPVPHFPGRVGLVTSAEGAALRDILSVLRRRRAGFDLVLAPSPVQGSGAASSLIRALRRLQSVPGVEVILLARGGGSLEDLWAFNDEALARAVAACRVPVISAVGHEVDTVLTDLTADLRAATPSVAAELLTARWEAALRAAQESERRLSSRALSSLRLMEERLRRASPGRLGGLLARGGDLLAQRGDRLQDRLLACLPGRIEAWSGRLVRTSEILAPEALAAWMGARRTRLEKAGGAMEPAMRRRLSVSADRSAAMARVLHSLSPLAVLGRGYAAAFTLDGKLLVSPGQAPEGTPLTLALREGALACRSEGAGSNGLPAALARPDSAIRSEMKVGPAPPGRSPGQVSPRKG
jgi:exodeoxyribonuclease VII large subunit